MKPYDSLGELLREYRLINMESASQAELGKLVGVEQKTWSDWERKISRVGLESLYKLAETTMIPFEVLFRLNNDYPTLYNIKTRRYANCPFDNNYVNSKILKQKLFDTTEQGLVYRLQKEKHLKTVLDFNSSLYPKKGFSKEVLESAIKKLPDLCLIITDSLGYYGGHLICYPISISMYENLVSGEIEEADLKPDDIIIPTPDEPIAFHFFAFFGTNSTHVYCLMKKLVYYINDNIESHFHSGSMISRFSVTKDGDELCMKIGMDEIRSYPDKYQEMGTENIPHMFAKRIMDLEWIAKYKDERYNHY